MLRSFANMVPDALLCFLHLPKDLCGLLAVDRFSNFLFLRWPHDSHVDYPLTVDLRRARQCEEYTREQQRCLLTFLQRASVVKIGHTWADRAWEWREHFNFYRYTSFRGPVEGMRRRSRYLGDSLWYFSSTPVSSPLHLRLEQQGALSRLCFVLTDKCDEDSVCETVLGSRRPSKSFLVELTLLFGHGRAHIAETFFCGQLVRQWYLVDPFVLTESSCDITLAFDCSTVSITMGKRKVPLLRV